jgi:ArsR family transcriptional regulator
MGSKGDGQAMIATGCGMNSRPGKISCEQVRKGPAHLKGACVLRGFEFEEQAIDVQTEVAASGLDDRRLTDVAAYDPLRGLNPFPVDLGFSTDHDDGYYLVDWLSVNMKIEHGLRALANEKRRRILEWLKNPTRHFPPQVDGDLEEDGVCGVLIASKLGVSQPTASEHLRILAHAGLVRSKRIKKWTFYQRDERRIDALKQVIATTI